MEIYILSESTKCFSIGDRCSSVPSMGPRCEVGMVTGREGPHRGQGGALLERGDEGRNVVVITFLLTKLFGVADMQKEILNRS